MLKTKQSDFMQFCISYSLYDGTDDNEKVKEEFVSAINCMVQEFK